MTDKPRRVRAFAVLDRDGQIRLPHIYASLTAAMQSDTRHADGRKIVPVTISKGRWKP